MSQENVEIVRQFWKAFNDLGIQEDVDGVLAEFFDPEIEWHDTPSLPGAAVYRGHAALQRHIEDYLDAWADSRFEIEEIRSVGDRVLTRAVTSESGGRAASPSKTTSSLASTTCGEDASCASSNS